MCIRDSLNTLRFLVLPVPDLTTPECALAALEDEKCRFGPSHSPDLLSGTFERAAPTTADPKEKLPSASVERCFGNGSPSRTEEWESCPEASFPFDGTLPRASDCEIPTRVAF